MKSSPLRFEIMRSGLCIFVLAVLLGLSGLVPGIVDAPPPGPILELFQMAIPLSILLIFCLQIQNRPKNLPSAMVCLAAMIVIFLVATWSGFTVFRFAEHPVDYIISLLLLSFAAVCLYYASLASVSPTANSIDVTRNPN